jgi:hypothetical protein
MSTELVVAAISFAAAVLAVVVGQLLSSSVERRAEARRWARAERDRHRTHGERAADDVLDALIEVDLGPFSYWQARKNPMRNVPGTKIRLPSHPPEPSQEELEPYVLRMRRHGLAIEDANAREAVRLAAFALYQYDTLGHLIRQRPSGTWFQIRHELETILGAYVRGDTVPEPTNLASFQKDLEDYFNETYESGD